jgi:hypothetical protein
MSGVEYLLRVHHEGEEFTATIRQFASSSHPEARAMAGPETTGQGNTAEAAMVHAIAAAHFGNVEMPRRGRYAC